MFSGLLSRHASVNTASAWCDITVRSGWISIPQIFAMWVTLLKVFKVKGQGHSVTKYTFAMEDHVLTVWHRGCLLLSFYDMMWQCWLALFFSALCMFVIFINRWSRIQISAHVPASGLRVSIIKWNDFCMFSECSFIPDLVQSSRGLIVVATCLYSGVIGCVIKAIWPKIALTLQKSHFYIGTVA